MKINMVKAFVVQKARVCLYLFLISLDLIRTLNIKPLLLRGEVEQR